MNNYHSDLSPVKRGVQGGAGERGAGEGRKGGGRKGGWRRKTRGREDGGI